ncbi:MULTISPECIES: biosynthetic arginine decarboxylase [unclassified Oleiphilus]|uniref:biosynthetic arginine decarboxylase n=3 Tax=Oleiphilus TaxID=141450 RepID=UPI0007C3ABA7|nr:MULTISPECIES: biosynthetic arginine decarboxylase [unclassified Oleiphilus]KZZ10975.1 arginine decarboxylase [Oleiphilus sp. HI0078]KZY30841.1 arginine decarboxylase [Oleiphilus sp. HI0043]KZY60416.1 arginine decarboxylase [Oleiphilus sp. HI0061]KZZ57628.1 arginine decarboxylase [Oleiphilus sp. HI0123]KZZ79489.1 arginine decarboxylase [Oleiphilus sp. HI0132]
MDQQQDKPSKIKQNIDRYGIDHWGNDYFGVSDEGCVTAKTLNVSIPLMNIVEGMIDRDLQMPVLLRVENILDAQIKRLNDAFAEAIEKLNYQSPYRGVYPIKVNQQAQVVEEIASFGARFKHGLEVGSKPEMIAALSTLEEPGSLIICNGYKDEEFIELGLQATKLGFLCFFVIETLTELPIIIRLSRQMNIQPHIGVRVKMTSQVSGHWNSTSGDRSVFGLTSTQLIDVVDKLKQENMLHCLELLHCHLGSQIPSIHDIRSGVVEACRYFTDLMSEGAELTHIDLGGGLAVDYTGAQSNDDKSRNYTLEEYCEDIVDTLKQTLDDHNIPHPTIVTESGRATVAYSSILLFNILDTNIFEPISLPEPSPEEHQLLTKIREIKDYLSPRRVQECYNDAHFYRDEVRALFKRGQLSLRERSIAENLFLDVLHCIADLLDTMDKTPPDLEDLKLSLADIYYGNFSLFQSLPDIWAIDQLFPIMPIHRLHETPTRQAVLADITCDCDGKIDKFINEFGTAKTLPLHPIKEGEEYYLGVFLVGAYQETLGDLHNLFGDTNVVSVRLNADGSFDFVKEIHGDTISDVLSYVEYQPKNMMLNYRNTAERAVKEGRITARERQQMIKTFNSSMQGYTYYEREH